jgi:hypothetical protein
MTSIRKVALACMTAAMLATSVNAGAQGPRNQDTFFTFSQAVELPKTTLPAGTYFFQLMDSNSNRHIVKVMSQDKKELHATLLAIPYYSNDRPSDDPQVRFMETPAQSANGGAATNAIKIWFYPGTSVGHEFIYPRAQALQIAARTGQSVLTTKTETEASETVADAELTRVDRNGVDTEANLTAQASPENAQQTATTQQSTTASTERSTTAQATEQPAPQREQVGAITGGQPDRSAERPADDSAPSPAPERTEDRAERRDLPRTAGVLPLLALIGLGSLVGSGMLRRARH